MRGRGLRLAKAKVAGSNPVFRSNYNGPAFLKNLKGPGTSFFGLRERLDPKWTPREQFRARDDVGLARVGLIVCRSRSAFSRRCRTPEIAPHATTSGVKP